MHSPQSRGKAGAFTLIELLMVMAIIAMLAAMLLPVLSQGKERAKQIQCVDHLRETGLAFHMFMHDHNSRFPMQVSTNEGGSLEFVRSSYRVRGDFYFSFRHFQTLSKELVTPKLLVCPSDLARWPATNFMALKNENVSYFVGVNADFAKPDSILAGDRNIADETLGSPTILHASPGNALRWTAELHRYKGNILFSDGHVEEPKSVRAASGDIFLPTIAQTAAAQNPGGSGTPSGPLSQGPAAGQPSPSSPDQTGKGSTGTNGPKPEDGVGGQPPPADGKKSPSGSSSASTRVGVTRIPAAAPPQPVITPKPKTNSPPVRSLNPPPAVAAPNSDTSPFPRWVAEMADELVHWAVWLLYALLLLLLVAVIILKLRQRSRRKQRPNDD